MVKVATFNINNIKPFALSGTKRSGMESAPGTAWPFSRGIVPAWDIEAM
ncbi:MAG TPA: hypothetical protein VK763_04245 [Terriglobales bacterium]|nr:hypothetical protein [Terriglobales bacterium]